MSTVTARLLSKLPDRAPTEGYESLIHGAHNTQERSRILSHDLEHASQTKYVRGLGNDKTRATAVGHGWFAACESTQSF
jgi:hypothetical protein